ncbi:MAG: hypothetical protein ACMUJM_25845 [bacterium]
MNKSISDKKVYAARGIIFAVVLLCAWDPALAAVSYPVVPSPVSHYEPYIGKFTSPSINAQLEANRGIIIIDNFEYRGSPLNQGWQKHAPTYPIDFHLWEMTTSPGLLSIVNDDQKESRVLELLYPSNMPFPSPSNMPFPSFPKYTVSYLLETEIPRKNSVLSLEMKAPLSEHFSSYEVIAIINSGLVEVHMIPGYREDNGARCPVTLPEDTAYINPFLVPFDRDINPTLIEVKIIREAVDGNWHLIKVDLAQVLANIGGTFENLTGVVLRGNEFRCENIVVSTKARSNRTERPPYLFHIDNIKGQIFDPPVGYRRYIFASDEVADTILPYKHTMEGEDGCYDEISYGNTAMYAELNGISLEEANFAFWQKSAMNAIDEVDTAISLADYAAAIGTFEATLDCTWKDVRRAAIQAGGDNIVIGLGAGGADITVDARLVYPLDVPMLLDPTMAEGPVASDGGINMLMFTGSIPDTNTDSGLASKLVRPGQCTEPIPYYPLYSKRGGVRSSLSGKPYLASQEVMSVAMSLYYGGYDYWPTIAVLAIPPEPTIDNMQIIIVCSNGLSEDVKSFTFEAVNHPVTNTPPVIEDVDDQIFYIGEGPQEYQLYATDHDSFTFTSDIQFRSDIENLTWSAYFKAYPFAYMLDPSIEPLIGKESGVILFDPQFEGAYEMVVTVRDPYGGEDSAEFTIYCINKAEWLDHISVMHSNLVGSFSCPGGMPSYDYVNCAPN